MLLGGCMAHSAHGHRIVIKHSSFTQRFSHFVRGHASRISRIHVTSLGDLGLGGFAGLDSGLDS